MALLMIRLKTYPLPSLEGNTPSAIKKAVERKWSAITLKDDLNGPLGSSLGANLEMSLIRFWNK